MIRNFILSSALCLLCSIAFSQTQETTIEHTDGSKTEVTTDHEGTSVEHTGSNGEHLQSESHGSGFEHETIVKDNTHEGDNVKDGVEKDPE